MKIVLLFLTISMKSFAWSCNCKWLFGEKIKITVDVEYDTAMLTWNQIAKASVYLVDVKYQGTQFGKSASWKEPKCQIKLKERGNYEVSVKAINEKKSVVAKGTVAFHYWADQQHKPGGESGPTMNPSQPSDTTNPNSKPQGQGSTQPIGNPKMAGNSKLMNPGGPSRPIVDPWEDDPPRLEGTNLNLKLEGIVGSVATFTWDHLRTVVFHRITIRHNGKLYGNKEDTSGKTIEYEFVLGESGRYDIKVQSFSHFDIWDIFLGEGISYVDTTETPNTPYIFPSGNPSFKVESVFGFVVEPNSRIKPTFHWVATEVPSGEWNVKIIHNRKEVVAVYHRQRTSYVECDLKKPGRYDFIVTVIKNRVQVGWGGTHVFVPGHGPTINLKAYDETGAPGSWRIEWNHVSSADHYNIDVKYWHGGEKQYGKNGLKSNKIKLEKIKSTRDDVVVAALDDLNESNLVAWGRANVASAEVVAE